MTGGRASTASIDAYHETGWLLCGGLLDVALEVLQDEVTAIAKWGDDGPWMQHYEMTDAGRRIARTENFTSYSPVLHTLLRDSSISDVAGALLGEPALLYKEKINYKVAGGAGFSPHQDKPAYPFVNSVLSVMVAVDDATVDNGCLFVASGMHHELLAQDALGCIEHDIADALRWEPVELAAGETLFFHALLPHRSGPNTSSADRRALYPTYNGISEGDLRDAYYEEKRRAFEGEADPARVRLSLIGDFEGRPA